MALDWHPASGDIVDVLFEGGSVKQRGTVKGEFESGNLFSVEWDNRMVSIVHKDNMTPWKAGDWTKVTVITGVDERGPYRMYKPEGSMGYQEATDTPKKHVWKSGDKAMVEIGNGPYPDGDYRIKASDGSLRYIQSCCLCPLPPTLDPAIERATVDVVKTARRIVASWRWAGPIVTPEAQALAFAVTTLDDLQNNTRDKAGSDATRLVMARKVVEDARCVLANPKEVNGIDSLRKSIDVLDAFDAAQTTPDPIAGPFEGVLRTVKSLLNRGILPKEDAAFLKHYVNIIEKARKDAE